MRIRTRFSTAARSPNVGPAPSSTRRSLTVESVSDLGRLDPEAIARVCDEAQPLVRTADELHDVVLLSRTIVRRQRDS